jgi:hypothetical protein
MMKYRNNRLMIVLFGMASLCFVFCFMSDETNGIEVPVSGFGLAMEGLNNLFSSNGGHSSGEWMVLAALCLALAGCCLNVFPGNSFEIINSLLAASAYLNLFSFRTQKMHGFSVTENADTLNLHFGWAYWLSLILLLIIVIQQTHRFIRWQHSSQVRIGDGYPSHIRKSH